MAAVHNQFASALQVLASATHTSANAWESLDGPDSRVGVDDWQRQRAIAEGARLNLDQGHLIISVDGEELFDAEVPARTGPQALKGRL